MDKKKSYTAIARRDKGKIVQFKNGLAVGKSHKEGGMSGIVQSTGKPIEFQGGEVIIKKESVELPGNCEKLSEINQQGGGDKIPCHLKERMEKNKFEEGGVTDSPAYPPAIENIKPIQEFTGYRYFEGLDPLSVDHQSNFKYGAGICLCTAADKVADLMKSRVCMTVKSKNPLVFESTGSEPNINFTRAWVSAGVAGPDAFAEMVFDQLGHDVMVIKYNTERGDDIVFKDKSIVKGYNDVKKFEEGGKLPESFKVKKKFDYKGIELKIIERDEYYMNAKEPSVIKRVMAPNGGIIPVRLNYKETLKEIQRKTIDFLESVEKRGFDVTKELTEQVDMEFIDINGIKIEPGQIVKSTQQGGGMMPSGEGETGIVEETKDAFGNKTLQIKFRKPGQDYDRFILLDNRINEVIPARRPFITQDGPGIKGVGRSYPLKPSKDSIVIEGITSYDDQTLSDILAFEIALKYTTDPKAKKELTEAIRALKISQKYK